MVKPRQIKGDAKARILDAADAIFVRHGIDGARMQQIADRAGVNKALLHYYFKSKAELARAAWLRFAVVYAPKVFQLLASDLSLEEKIEQYVDAYHAMLTRYPYVLTYVVSEGARRPDFFSDYYTPERRKAARQMVIKLRKQIDELRKQLQRYSDALENDLAAGRDRIATRVKEALTFEKKFDEASTVLLSHLREKPECRDLIEELTSSERERAAALRQQQKPTKREGEPNPNGPVV